MKIYIYICIYYNQDITDSQKGYDRGANNIKAINTIKVYRFLAKTIFGMTGG